MAMRTCLYCVYARFDPEDWLRCFWRGVHPWIQCANHPWWPGELHDVSGVPCRNYLPRLPEPSGSVRWIPVGDGQYTSVDAADYPWLSRWSWHSINGYAIRRENGKVVFMHRQIMQPPEGMVVDHIDGRRANNCRSNLRVCTHQENTRNKRKHKDTSSIYKGVYYDKQVLKWGAVCLRRGKPHRLGYFEDEAEAGRAYDRAAVEAFKGFARLNFPEEWPPQRRAEVYAQAEQAQADQAKENSKKRKKNGSKKAPSRAKPQGRPSRKRKPKSTRATGHGAPATRKKPHTKPPTRNGRKRKAKSTRATGHGAPVTPAKGRASKKPKKAAAKSKAPAKRSARDAPRKTKKAG